jgi:hypothetical protein
MNHPAHPVPPCPHELINYMECSGLGVPLNTGEMTNEMKIFNENEMQ